MTNCKRCEQETCGGEFCRDECEIYFLRSENEELRMTAALAIPPTHRVKELEAEVGRFRDALVHLANSFPKIITKVIEG